MPDGTAHPAIDRDDTAALLHLLRRPLEAAPPAHGRPRPFNDPRDIASMVVLGPDGSLLLNPATVRRLQPLLRAGHLYDSALLIHALRVNTDLPAEAIADILNAARLDAVPGLEPPKVERIAVRAVRTGS